MDRRKFVAILLCVTMIPMVASLQSCNLVTNPDVSVDLPVRPDRNALDGMATKDEALFLVPVAEADASALVLRVATETAVASRTLSAVKFAPQVPPGEWAKTMSCGPACLNLAAAYAYGATPDQVTYIRAINRYLGKTDINNCLPGGTGVSQLVSAAKAVNNCPNTYSATGWTLARLRQEIDAGRPVVVAVHSGRLPTRTYSYSGGHFVCVVGYDGANMITHDVGTSRGAFKAYPNADFANAMAYFGGAVVVVRR